MWYAEADATRRAVTFAQGPGGSIGSARTTFFPSNSGWRKTTPATPWSCSPEPKRRMRRPALASDGKSTTSVSRLIWIQVPAGRMESRSEEHTSELQSQSNLVCRLLLEKKKKRRQERRAKHEGDVYAKQMSG